MKTFIEKAETIFETVFKASQADETEVHISWGLDSLTRFANNEIHQNMSDENFEISIRSNIGQKTARATTNKRETEALKETTLLSNRLASLNDEDPELLPMPGPQKYTPVAHAHERTGAIKAEVRAHAVRVPIQIAESKGLKAAGIFSNGLERMAIGNSKGLRAYSEETYAVFSTTMMSDTGSGWAKLGHIQADKIPLETLALQASEKAILSREPVELTPGPYTVILEPSAVLDLLEFMLMDFGGLSVHEKRSCFTDKLGRKIFGNNITIEDDVYHPLQGGPSFDGEGIPKQKVCLIEKGILKNLVYSRSSAKIAKTKATGHGFSIPNAWGEAPTNIVFSGGNSSIEEMVKSTKRGLLITRFWYIREVDSMQKILTGMTRDGTFLIENGGIKNAVRNMRFNESLFHFLNSIDILGPSVRAAGEEGIDMVVPPLRATDFHFTGVTKY